MLNWTERKITKLDKLIGKNDPTDLTKIEIASYKDAEGNLHPFIYDVNDEELTHLKIHLDRLYRVFIDDKFTSNLWSKLISNFENVFDIEFFELISYVYMLNIEVAERDVTTFSQVVKALIYTSDQLRNALEN